MKKQLYDEKALRDLADERREMESPGGALCNPEDVAMFNRRQLLKTGFSLTGYMAMSQLFNAGLGLAAGYPAIRKLVWINMGGGWDILEVTDPKPASTSGIQMAYGWDEANTISGAADDVRIGRWLPKVAGIGDDLLVVRGLAMGTTSHTAGSVYMDTGVLSNAGNVNAASIPAIVASESTATIPIIQLNGGSEPMTDRGLLNPVSVVRAQNLDLYRSMYPTGSAQIQQRMRVLDYIRASVSRTQGQVGVNDRLTAVDTAESKLRTQFANNVANNLVLANSDRAAFMNGAPTSLRAGGADAFALALKLIKNDLVTCVNLGMGGFDTHASQDTRMRPLMDSFDHQLRVFVDELRAAGKLDTTLIVVYSDFGRTPRINSSNGRDHWPVGGALMLGGGIDGARVVGATDDNLLARAVNITTGLPDAAGTQINPTHLGGSVLSLTLGAAYMQYRSYLTALPALTRLKS